MDYAFRFHPHLHLASSGFDYHDPSFLVADAVAACKMDEVNYPSSWDCLDSDVVAVGNEPLDFLAWVNSHFD